MKEKRKLLIGVLLFWVLLAGTIVRHGNAAYGAPAAQRIVLPNNLVLLIIEEHSLPVLTMQLLTDAGSWRDPAGEEGLANLTARSLLLGTSTRSAGELNEAFDFIGTALDVTCEKDYATFSMQVLKKNMLQGFELFMEVLAAPTFPVEEVQREIEKTMGAIRSSEDQPSEVAEKAFEKTLYTVSPYAHPVEGSRESLGRLSRQAILQFYQSYYHSGNSILAVVGDITVEEVKENLIPRLATRPERISPSRPFISEFLEGPKTVKIDRPITQANIMLGHRGVARGNKDYYAITVMNFILGGGDLSSRLLEEIRVKRGLVYFVGSSFIPRKHPGPFLVAMQTKNASAREAISLVLQEMERMKKEPVSEEELKTAVKYLVGSFLVRYDTQKNLADLYTQIEYYGLGMDYPDKYPSLINAVTREDVLRAARTYLHPDHYILVIVGNLKETGMDE